MIESMCSFDLSDNDFSCFSSFIYDKCGISISSGKKELIKARLGKRLRELSLKNFKDYYSYLINDSSGKEIVEFINAISTNLTSFFREEKHFDFLIKEALPSIIAKNRNQLIKVWSAGCSSGEEAYSIAISLNEYSENVLPLNTKVLATDISTKVLQKAMDGIYGTSQIAKIPSNILRKYFQKGQGQWDGCFRVKENLKQNISFRRFNLMDTFPFNEKFNFIFCRNVMIYFDKEIQERLVNKFYNCLNDNGFLFVGHSESLMGLNHKYKYIKPAVYFKSLS
ncbi:MAG: protein-glutamate O-methyltransferase CheR [Desulfobacterales bacterium]|nr:protein-glutamate O-methyltransferase CheR [Desulfobacterales bacterium]